MSVEPLRVACLGMGWWSDVLADAIVRSGKLKIAACYTRSEEKRAKFAAKYACKAAPSYEAILEDRTIEAVVNTTPNNVHLETTRTAAAAGKHVFLDKPIANTSPTRARSPRRAGKRAWSSPSATSAVAKSQFRWIRRQIDDGVFGRLVNGEANISRDRLGKIDLGSWRYTAEGMPGGVMLQIGVHYTDVLEYLLGPVKAVSGSLAQLVLPGDNPDVASLILEHESGALSTVNASYASASEYYLMNVYGKEASAYYDFHQGLRFLKRGAERSEPVAVAKIDAFVDELEEFARAARGQGQPEMDGEAATRSLAVHPRGDRVGAHGRRVDGRRGAGGQEGLGGDCDGSHEKNAADRLRRAAPVRVRAGAAVPAARQRRDHRAVPCRHVGRRHRPPARRGDVEAARPDRARRQPPRRGRRDRLQVRREPEARRLLARLELELDLDHVSLGPARLRLQGVRSGGAGAGRVAGASRCAATRDGRRSAT